MSSSLVSLIKSNFPSLCYQSIFFLLDLGVFSLRSKHQGCVNEDCPSSGFFNFLCCCVFLFSFSSNKNLEWLKMALKKENAIPGLPKDVQGLVLLFVVFPPLFPFFLSSFLGIIADNSQWHFTHEDALKYRQELMDERKYFTKQNSSEKFEREFSLCEH